MANDFEDVGGILDPEEQVASTSLSRDALLEQMRQEEEALLAASRARLPAQSAEAESARAAFGGAEQYGGIQQPVPLRFGQVMPTRSGFMYVGNPAGAPAPGGPLAARTALESAAARQNLPAANVALGDLSRMGLGPQSAFIGPPRTTTPEPPSVDQMRFEAMQRYQSALAANKTPAEALQLSGLDFFSSGRRSSIPAQRPLWVPSDPATGAPGHFETSAGTIHIPSVPKPTTTKKLTPPSWETADYNRDMKEMQAKEAQLELEVKTHGPDTPKAKELSAQWMAISDRTSKFRAKYDPSQAAPAPPPAAAPAPAPLLPPTTTTGSTKAKTLDKATAQKFLDQAKGDKKKARDLARAAGYAV